MADKKSLSCSKIKRQSGDVLIECAIILPVLVVTILALVDALRVIATHQRLISLATELAVGPQAKALSINSADASIAPVSGTNLKTFMDSFGSYFRESPNRGNASMMLALDYLNIVPETGALPNSPLGGTVDQNKSCRASCCQSSTCGEVNVDFVNVPFENEKINCPGETGSDWCAQQSIYTYAAEAGLAVPGNNSDDINQFSKYIAESLAKFKDAGAARPIGTRIYSLTVNGKVQRLYFESFSLLFIRVMEEIPTFVLPSQRVVRNFLLIPRKEVAFYED